jgi:hypothetical protein
LKKPNRATVGLMMSKGRDPLAMIDVILANCWIDGDESIKEDTSALYSMLEKLDEIIGKKTVELKNF